MSTLKIIEVYNEHPTEDDRRKHEEGFRILARIIARARLRERSKRKIQKEVPRVPVKQPA